MSYTPTLQAEVLDRRLTPELEDALAETSERLFVDGQLGGMNIPSPLRLGPKTAAAIRHLLTAHSPWFSLSDKVQYLLESRSLRPYRHYWGLLAGVFPDRRASVVSDLLIHAQSKLRALLFLELANRPEYHAVLSDYFNRFLTSGWRNPSVAHLLRSVSNKPTPWINSVVTEGFRMCAAVIANEAPKDFAAAVESPGKIDLPTFYRGYNKFRAAVWWNKTETAKVLTARIPLQVRDADPIQFILSRAFLRVSHRLQQKTWANQWLDELLARADDPSYGAPYAAHTSLYYSNRLTDERVRFILTPYQIPAAWDHVATDCFLNETTANAGESWYRSDPVRRVSDLIRLIVYLRAHPKPELITAISTAELRIRNVLRSFRRHEYEQPKMRRVSSLPLGHLVLDWAGRLERYLQTAAW